MLQAALETYLRRVDGGADHREATLAAAQLVARRPPDVVRYAGALARCRLAVAEAPFGLTHNLRHVPIDSRAAIARVSPGQRYPDRVHAARLLRGGFEPSVEQAREVVAHAAPVARGVRVGLDAACGAGAFLVAMAEVGVTEIYGTDTDPLVLEVASVACPTARLALDDGLRLGPPVDLVCGAPPFVAPEHQDRRLRFDLRRRFPWLRRRVDLSLPWAAACMERLQAGGAAGFWLPAHALVASHGAGVRRRWLGRHRVAALLPRGDLCAVLVLVAGGGPSGLPSGMSAEELLSVPNAPLDPTLVDGDGDRAAAIAARAVPLGQLGRIDVGVAPSSRGAGLTVHATPGPGRVPFADASAFFAGSVQWLDDRGSLSERARFEAPKVVVQRARGGPPRVAVDCDGIFVGRRCLTVTAADPRLELDAIRELLLSPIVRGYLRIVRGWSPEWCPEDLADAPVPRAWLAGERVPLAAAFGLGDEDAARLAELAGG